MAELTQQQLQQILSTVASSIERQSSDLIKEIRSDPEARLRKIREEKTLKNSTEIRDEIKRLLKTTSNSNKDIEQMSFYSSRLLDETMRSASSVKNLDKLIRIIPEKFKAALGVHSTELADSIQTMGDVMKFQEMAPALHNLSEEMAKNDSSIDDLIKILDKANKIEKDFNIDLKRLGVDVESFIKARELEIELSEKGIELDVKHKEIINKSIKDFESLNGALKEANKSLISISKSGGAGGGIFGKMGGMMGTVTKMAASAAGVAVAGGMLLKPIYDAAKIAGRFGVALDPITSTLTGLSLEELPELQARFKQTALSIGGLNNFNDILRKTLVDTNLEFINTAGGLAEASRAIAMMTNNIRSMGDSSINTTTAIDNEISLSKRFQKEMGITVDGFNDLTNELVGDADIRNQLMRLDQIQRKAYLDNIRLRILDNHQMGLSTEQAKAAAKALSGIAGMDPRERLRLAARTRALGGALGMGEQAEVAAKAIMQGSRASAELQKEAAVAINEINAKGMAKMGENMGSELFMAQFANMPDMGKVFGPDSAFSQAILGAGKAFNEEVRKGANEQGIFNENMANLLSHYGISMESGLATTQKTLGQVQTAVGQGIIMGTYSGLNAMAKQAGIGEGLVDLSDTNSILVGIFKVVDNIWSLVSTQESYFDKLERLQQDVVKKTEAEKASREDKERSTQMLWKMLVDLQSKMVDSSKLTNDQMQNYLNQQSAQLEMLSKLLGISKEQLIQSIKDGETLDKIRKKPVIEDLNARK